MRFHFLFCTVGPALSPENFRVTVRSALCTASQCTHLRGCDIRMPHEGYTVELPSPISLLAAMRRGKDWPGLGLSLPLGQGRVQAKESDGDSGATRPVQDNQTSSVLKAERSAASFLSQTEKHKLTELVSYNATRSNPLPFQILLLNSH